MTLEVHFLNVGNGDCTVVRHNSGRLSILDINNVATLSASDEADMSQHYGAAGWKVTRPELQGLSWERYYKALLVDPLVFLEKNYATDPIFRFIQSHPDMDHMSGLDRLLTERPPLVFWDTDNSKSLEPDQFPAGGPFRPEDWERYQSVRNGEEGIQVLKNLRGAEAHFWTDDSIEILSPSPELLADADRAEDWNRSSYVLKLSHAGRSILLPGDADCHTWDHLEEHFDKDDLASDVLKAAHHGRMSGYSETAVDKIDPSIVISSVGKRPATDASNEYRKHADSVLSTRFHGTISVFIGDNGAVEVTNFAGSLLHDLPALV